jgi:hypothetical protein
VRCAWGGCLLYSGGVVSPRASERHARRAEGAYSSVVPQHRRLCHPSFRRPGLTKPQRRFTHVHPSSLSLARFALMGRPLLRRYLELCTPSLPTTHIKIGNRRWTLTWDEEVLPPRPLIRCDRVSQSPAPIVPAGGGQAPAHAAHRRADPGRVVAHDLVRPRQPVGEWPQGTGGRPAQPPRRVPIL